MRAIAILLFIAGATEILSPTEATANSLRRRDACDALQRRVSEIEGLPSTGPSGIGWYCEFSKWGNETWYVIALRLHRQCEGICSNLMGWFAVNRLTAVIHEYDVAELRVGKLLEKP